MPGPRGWCKGIVLGREMKSAFGRPLRSGMQKFSVLAEMRGVATVSDCPGWYADRRSPGGCRPRMFRRRRKNQGSRTMQEATTKGIYDFHSVFYDATFGRLVKRRIA